MSTRTIALVGDYSGQVTAHRAIPRALELARDRSGLDLDWKWVATRDLTSPVADLEPYAAVWVVPASPYENIAGAFGAIRWAREGGHPFFGTCGGFQHAILEFAAAVAQIPGAAHAETAPGAADLVVTRLSCSLVEASGRIHFEKGSLLARANGADSVVGEYRCNYGPNATYRPALEKAGLRFTAWDDAGDIRGAELPSHPFFCGVLYQPERASLKGELSPLVHAFARAAAGV
jgi:CTP synthase (UTP-ammonia lyase)